MPERKCVSIFPKDADATQQVDDANQLLEDGWHVVNVVLGLNRVSLTFETLDVVPEKPTDMPESQAERDQVISEAVQRARARTDQGVR